MNRIFWTQRQNMGPSARRDQAMAYDPSRQKTVLFGGTHTPPNPDDSPYLADTWEWDGQFWTQMSDIGPAPLGSYAMDWDATSEQVVLFGGGGRPNAPGLKEHDTWAWDGLNWTQLDDSGPEARFSFALASDTTRQRIVLFGGASSGGPDLIALSDTWEWDGEAWTQQEETGPQARSGHAMAFDASRGRIVLTGGISLAGIPFRDTWEWDGTTWTHMSEVGPVGRVGAFMAYDGNQVVLFGGEDWTVNPHALRGDTWSWDGRFWTQRQDIGPSPRQAHRMANDSVRSRIILFGGGVNSGDASDTWELAARNAPGSE